MLSKLVVPNQTSKRIMKINGEVADLKLTGRVCKYRDLFPLNVIRDMGKDPDETVITSVRKSKFHLRWMYTGWPCVIELASMTIGGDIGWRIAFNGCLGENLTNCFNGTLIGSIPSPNSPLTSCNMPGYTSSQASGLFRGSYSNIPPLSSDTTNWDLTLFDALYLDNLPLFRTWQLTHESYGAKYSTDGKAFKELDLDHDANNNTYELQMNDSLSYGESTYDDAAFVFYRLGG